MNGKITSLRLIVGLLLLIAWSLESPKSEIQAQEFSTLNLNDSNAEKKLIAGVLTRQADAWNQGDLNQFMKTYWKSPLLTFSAGGKTTRGWDATLKRYQENYAPPKEMGKLKFGELEVTLMESKTAMVLGNWYLEMPDQKHRSGNFSLVLHKMDDQWRIIHDHSSSVEEPEIGAGGAPQPAIPTAQSATDGLPEKPN
jgi:uncharacterized protein (TIGR02246 family)